MICVTILTLHGEITVKLSWDGRGTEVSQKIKWRPCLCWSAYPFLTSRIGGLQIFGNGVRHTFGVKYSRFDETDQTFGW